MFRVFVASHHCESHIAVLLLWSFILSLIVSLLSDTDTVNTLVLMTFMAENTNEYTVSLTAYGNNLAKKRYMEQSCVGF